jgi:chromosome segregation ATPase
LLEEKLKGIQNSNDSNSNKIEELKIDTGKKIIEMESGNEKLLEKVLGIETNIEKEFAEQRKKSKEVDQDFLSLKKDVVKNSEDIIDANVKLKNNDDQLKSVDDTLNTINKTIQILESRHVETVSKMKEVMTLAHNIQLNMNEKEEKMAEKSLTDLNKLKEQIKDLDNQNCIAAQRITELDSGSQSLFEKIFGLEESLKQRLITQTNSVKSLEDSFSKSLEENEEKLKLAETKIAELDAENQQLLEKLLGLEKDFDGKFDDNSKEVEGKLNSLDVESKKNLQSLVSLQESIYLQSEQVKKVDAERQQAAVKAKDDL